MKTTIPVCYKNKKSYNTARYPIRQPRFFVFLIWLLSRLSLARMPHRVEKIGMEGIEPPYLLFSNHMCFLDFELAALATYPHRVNNVVNIDGYYRRPHLLEMIGAICTRKFVTDLHLVKSIRRVLQRGDILCMYPEARYSPCGVTSFLPESLGKLVKLNKVPVVIIQHHGNHLYAPFWNYRHKRKVPFYTTMTRLLTAEQVAAMTVEEINEAIRNAFIYDDYRYQKENGIRITEPYRAEGLDKVLYQCPCCGAEQMTSAGAELRCTACGKVWHWREDGDLEALEGETEFSHIPDWFQWEREQVKAEIARGEYRFRDEVDVYSLPHCWKYRPLGKATLTHDPEDGFVLEGFHNGAPYRIVRAPIQQNSLHVEYGFPHIRPEDCLDLSTENDSFYCFPSKRNVVTKLAFATEEIYHLAQERTIQGEHHGA